MEGIKWPVDKCVNCGKDLTEVVARPYEKSSCKDGSDSWSDHCPQCGKGYIVGERSAPIQRGVSAKVILSQAEIIASAPGERKAKATTEPQPAPEPEPEKAPESPPDNIYDPEKTHEPHRSTKKGEFFCTKCASIHQESSKQGAKHLKFKEA